MSQENTKELLWLQSKQIGDASVTALTKFAHGGAMAHLEKRSLSYNKIGDAGVTALADACATGALADCRNIQLRENHGNEAPVRNILRER